MDNNNLLMIIDGFHYETILLIKNYDYSKDINILSTEIKKKIDKVLSFFYDKFYGYEFLFLKLLCGIS